MLSLVDLEIDTRVRNALLSVGYAGTDDLGESTRRDLLRVPFIGPKAISQLADTFSAHGLNHHPSWLAPVKITEENRRIGAGTPGPGRPKGSLNKTTALLKDAILAAATKAGREDGLEGYLAKQAEDNPAAFLTLLGKVLPLQVAGDTDNPVRHVMRVELVALK